MHPMTLHTNHSQSGLMKTNRQGRRPGKTACMACHVRKKKCEIAPPYHQCTHCRKENQSCIPRDPIERATRQRGTKRIHNRHATQKITKNNHENNWIQVNKYPSPPQIDTEVPHWSPLYSFYSEMRRLLPIASTPPSPSSETEENSGDMHSVRDARKENIPSRFKDGDCTGKICIKGIGIPNSRSSCSAPTALNKEVDWEQTLAAYEARILHGNLGSVESQHGRDSGLMNDVFTNNDLDALENIYAFL